MKTTFRVSRNYPKILRNRKRRIDRRLALRHWADQEHPMMGGSNIHYELSQKTRASGYGGMGAVHLMVQRLGLVEQINQNLKLLKVHLPYHESDHVLNIAYNVLVGGERLKTLNCGGRMKVFSTVWGRSAFRTRPRREISPGASRSKILRSCRSASTGRGSGCGKSNRRDF